MIMNTWNRRLTIMTLSIGVLLLIPFIGMQFTNEINWSLFDFVVAGALLTGTAIACEFVIRKVRTPRLRIAICAAVLLMLLLVWIELAVGIFGTPLAGS